MSRQGAPKQFLDIVGCGKSLLRQTFERFLPIIEVENFIIVTSRKYRDMVLEHIPEINPEQILCEPIGRNTAPAVSFAAYYIMKQNPEAEMIVTPADNIIGDTEEFLKIVEQGFEFTQDNDALITIGAKPTRPDTGYGYIQRSDTNEISRVKSFTEKPSIEIALTFIQYGEFFWSCGIFIFSVRDIIKTFEQCTPENHALFSSIMEQYGTEQQEMAIYKVYSECRSIAIDHVVMEQAETVYVRVGEFGWSDIGTWGSLYQHSQRDKGGNISQENALMHDSRNCVVSVPDGKIAVIAGLNDYIVADTEDILLICPRSDEQNIKKYIDEVKYQKGEGFC